MAKQYTTEELADRWYDKREILNLAGKYVTSMLLKQEAQIFPSFWASADDVCLCFNDGYYCGQKAVADYFQAVSRNTAIKSQFLKKLFPDQLGNLTDEELYGVGQLQSLPITTPVIEIAEDRQTAKGIWHIEGSDNGVSTKGPISYWSIGFLCVDFLREEEDWKLWHVFYAEEIKCPMGESWIEPKDHPDNSQFSDLADCTIPAYTGTGTFYAPYSKERPFTAPPRLPEPYSTFAETFSYGI